MNEGGGKMQKADAEYEEYDTSIWFSKSEQNFDPRADFLEFLETAKMHASEMSAKGTEHFPNTAKHESKASEVRKSKKPWSLWKKSLFFWSKSKKKVSPGQDPSSPVRITSAHGIVPPYKRSAKSGPITSSNHRTATSLYTSGRPTSGPLGFGGWFTPTRSNEFDTPYMCLNQLDRPNHLKDYGPIYLVT